MARNQSKFNRNDKVDKKSHNKNGNPHRKHQNRENNQRKNFNEGKTTKANDNDNKKIHYVLNPKALQKRIKEVKESEQKTKEKSFQEKSKSRF